MTVVEFSQGISTGEAPEKITEITEHPTQAFQNIGHYEYRRH